LREGKFGVQGGIEGSMKCDGMYVEGGRYLGKYDVD
jgi:hypothetical protein